MPASNPNLQDIILAARLIRDSKARSVYLDTVCGSDLQLRKQVEDVLAGKSVVGTPVGRTVDHERGDSRGRGAGNLSSCHVETASLPDAFSDVAKVIGRYRLLQQLGEGGMGAVYMAEQEEPVRRRVALKIIKPGMDSRQVLARFEVERQVLAMMEHPNIAQVFDAGTTDQHRPYFVMELVRGLPITTYCDERKLLLHDRLRLFLPVCRAIQHAHSKGIIHRDIKPSNVLVCDLDQGPVPKVIDFGVAKAVQQRLTDKSLFTQIGQIVGTLEYMSPEQAGVSQLDVDTRSDVYSLGVLLYELLTGSTPVSRWQLRDAGIAEMLKVIREEEAEKPSTRLSSSGEALTTIAFHRGTEPKRLGALLRGDLDWIVMKSLDKDRNRRYDAASNLARDIERHLHNDPVEARPPSLLYQVGKLAKKHQTGISVFGAFFILLALASVISC